MALLVESVVVSANEVRKIVWAPAARPFFGTAEAPASAKERDPSPITRTPHVRRGKRAGPARAHARASVGA